VGFFRFRIGGARRLATTLMLLMMMLFVVVEIQFLRLLSPPSPPSRRSCVHYSQRRRGPPSREGRGLLNGPLFFLSYMRIFFCWVKKKSFFLFFLLAIESYSASRPNTPRRGVFFLLGRDSLVGARGGETAAHGTHGLLSGGGGDHLLLLLLLGHGHGHHGDAGADGHAHADEGTEGDDGERGVDGLDGRHFFECAVCVVVVESF